MKKTILRILLPALLLYPLAGCASGNPDVTAADTTLAASEAITTAAETTASGTEATTEPSETTAAAPVVTDPVADSYLETVVPYKGDKVKIACIGDSLTYGYASTNPATNSYPSVLGQLLGDSYQVGNFGKSSSYVLDPDNPYNIKEKSLSYRNTEEYKKSLAFEPDIVILMLGTNDMRSMSCAEALEAYKADLCNLATEYSLLPSVKKVYIATSPQAVNAPVIVQMTGGVLQQLQREAAASAGFEVLDLYAELGDYFDVMIHTTKDRVHPTDSMYADMAQVFFRLLTGKASLSPEIPLSESGVVYLSTRGKDTNDGSTPEKAVATLARAVALVRRGGTIVLTGVCNISYDTSLPQNSGRIVITSSYDGQDYNGSLILSKNLTLNGDFTFENLIFRINLDNSIITCNYHNVTFGNGITCTLQGSTKTYPLILAGCNVGIGGIPVERISLTDTCCITVNSGTWSYVRCGNRRSNAGFPIGTVEKNTSLNVTVNGGVFCNTIGNLTSATGMNTVEGECTLTINGGEFRGPVYAVGRIGDNTTGVRPIMSGKVSLIIRGGSFAGMIGATQDSSSSVTGTISVTLSESTRSLANKLIGFSSVDYED